MYGFYSISFQQCLHKYIAVKLQVSLPTQFLITQYGCLEATNFQGPKMIPWNGQDAWVDLLQSHPPTFTDVQQYEQLHVQFLNIPSQDQFVNLNWISLDFKTPSLSLPNQTIHRIPSIYTFHMYAGFFFKECTEKIWLQILVKQSVIHTITFC